MKMQNGSKAEAQTEISSSMYVEARMTSNFSELERLLSNLPNARILSSGTRVRCAIKEPKTLVECSSSGIVYSYAVDDSSVHTANSRLVAMLSLLAYLGGVYEVRFPSLYRYLIAAINVSGIGIGTPPDVSKHQADSRFEELAESNCTLAGSIRGFAGENRALKARVSVYRSLTLALLKKLSKSALSKTAIVELSRELGMEKKLFEDAANSLEEEGQICIGRGDCDGRE